MIQPIQPNVQPPIFLEKAEESKATISPNFYLQAGLSPAQKRILPKVTQIADNIFEGGYPADRSNPMKTREMQRVLIEELGITHYVCLIDNKQLQKFPNYRKEIHTAKKPTWIQFQIIDQRTAKDADVNAFTDQLVELVKNKSNRVFIHCWGGNGRTNTIASILMSKLYNWSWEQSLVHLFKCYLQRKIPTTDRLPETKEQFEQVKRLCKGSKMNFEKWKAICQKIKSELRPDLNRKAQCFLPPARGRKFFYVIKK